MSLNFFRNVKVFHGMSEPSHKSMCKNNEPFLIAENTDRWLIAKGLYFVIERPLIALRYARQAAINQGYQENEIVVLEYLLSDFKLANVLNLCSDEGQYILWKCYAELRQFLNSQKVISRKVAQFSAYQQDLAASQNARRKKISELISQMWQTDDAGQKKNPDSYAILLLNAAENGYDAVLAMFQEGEPVSTYFNQKMPTYDSTPAYRGIRIRDHLELCLVDPQQIQTLQFEVRTQQCIESRYADHQSFCNEASSIRKS